MVKPLRPTVLFAEVLVPLVLLLNTINAEAEPSPFTAGTQKFGKLLFSPQKYGCPLYSTMYYPLKPAVYTPIFFLGGVYDLVRTDIYSDYLEDLTRHGYIVIGIDIEPKPNTTLQFQVQAKSRNGSVTNRTMTNEQLESIFVTQIKWLRGRIDHMTKAIPNWRKLTVSCQSASCTNILSIVRSHPTLAAAAIFLDPVCMFSSDFKPVKSKTVALAYVSHKSFTFPFCCMSGWGYKKVYELMTSVKVRMSVRDFGHCGLMNDGVWTLCKETHICQVGEQSRVREYKLFTAGMVHAFLRWTLDKNLHYERYVTDKSLMPLVVNDLAYNTTRPH